MSASRSDSCRDSDCSVMRVVGGSAESSFERGLGTVMVQRQWLGLCGVVSALLVFVGLLVLGANAPNADARAATVVSFYKAHDARNKAAAIAVIVAAALLVLFAAQLRQVLERNESGVAVLPLAAFGGALLISAGLLFAATAHLALVDAASHGLPKSAQALNALKLQPLCNVRRIRGLLFAAGVTTVRRPALPRWLGWAAIVSGVLAQAVGIGFIGSALGLVWILVVGILMLRKDPIADATATPPGP